MSLLALTGFTKYNLHICTKDIEFACLKQQTVQMCLGVIVSALGFKHGSLPARGTGFSQAGSTSCTSSCLPVLVEHNTLTPTNWCFYKTNPKAASGHMQVWCNHAAAALSHHGAWGQAPRGGTGVPWHWPSLHQRAYI